MPPETPRLCGVRRPLTARHITAATRTPRAVDRTAPPPFCESYDYPTTYRRYCVRLAPIHLFSPSVASRPRRWRSSMVATRPPDTRIRRSARSHLPPTSHLLTYGLDEFSSPSQYLVSDPPSGASSGHAVSCAPSTFRRFGRSRCCGREASLWRRPAADPEIEGWVPTAKSCSMLASR